MSELRYIVIEGVIGVGKTSLAQLLTERLHGRLVLERPEENPFLESFYLDPRRYAFQTQLFFLLSRYRQQQELPQPDFFHPILVADYLFAKDKIFAYITLSEVELLLYERVWEILEPRIRKPDLVIYLQSSTERLMQNIRLRNRPYESPISKEYIRTLNEAYNQFFLHYNDTSLLIVNATRLDFVKSREDLESLTREITRERTGKTFYNPGEK
ncbi:MAG: deoxynucleoside kinase [bacterium]